MTPTKKVMFVVPAAARGSPLTGATRSPIVGTTDSTPDEEHDMFDFDEAISEVPIKVVSNPSPKPLGSLALTRNTLLISPFVKDQLDLGLSGSFRKRNTSKYASDVEDDMHPSDLDQDHLPGLTREPTDDDEEASPFATSLPMRINFPPATLSPTKTAAQALQQGEVSDDTPTDDGLGGIPAKTTDSRKSMWDKAIASSLRMSGLVLRTQFDDGVTDDHQYHSAIFDVPQSSNRSLVGFGTE